MDKVRLTPSLIEGFVSIFLHERFDNPKAIPRFHRDIWELFCDDHNMVAVAAPRGHAKSTAGTHACALASILFGFKDHIVIISATEKMASDHLKDLATELTENEAIVSTFNVKLKGGEGIRNNDTEIIGQVGDRWFRVVAKGAEQKVRGLKWRHKRPNLILIDDLEEDEAVQNIERRIKLREWIDDAVVPLGGDTCVIRAFGTVLHFDSWLARTLESPEWKTARYAAHAGFDDFSEILWPEKFPEARLRQIRGLYLANSNPSGYSQEYLNQPIADLDNYFKQSDFIAMEEEHRRSPKKYYIGVDFAISKADRANQTAMVVGGVDPESYLNVVDVRAGRWDSLEIIDNMFRLQQQYNPEMWILEEGVIHKSLGPVINSEMVRRGIFMNIQAVAPTKEKMVRAQGIRLRMRAGGVRFDKEQEWYTPFEVELMQFPRSGKDDRVDAIAWLGLFMDELQASLTVKELSQMEWEEEMADTMEEGKNPVTGY